MTEDATNAHAREDQRAPTVSIVVPMRNAGRYIETCLASVLSEVQVSLEVIIVDDGSTDESAAIARAIPDPRVRLVAGPCEGIAAAMNCGLANAQGEILMRCDADDAYPPGRIARQVALLKEEPARVAVCGAFVMIDEQGRKINDLTESCGRGTLDISAELRSSPARTHLCTFGIRSEAARRLGGFRAFFETAEDLDYQYRLAECGPILYVPEVFYLYRLHAQSITHSQPNSRRLFFEAMATAMQQDRLKTGMDDLMRGAPPVLPLSHHTVGEAHSADAHIQNQLIGTAWAAFARREFRSALGAAAMSVRRDPSRFQAWKTLGLIGLKTLRQIVLRMILR